MVERCGECYAVVGHTDECRWVATAPADEVLDDARSTITGLVTERDEAIVAPDTERACADCATEIESAIGGSENGA